MKQNSNIKKLHLIIIGIMISALLPAQQEVTNPFIEKQEPQNRWMFEGIVGFQFGAFSLLEISPVAGYKVTENFTSGIGLTYQFSNYQNFYLNTETGNQEDRQMNILGARIYSVGTTSATGSKGC